ncbi:hypothetical protein BC940DRAFT_68487 [Gongronella butleri]|nr:hypothetical protein BC940DRAFT_68487 [Gongronella butleri]
MPVSSRVADLAQKSFVVLLAGTTVYYMVNIGLMVNKRMELKKQGKLQDELVSFVRWKGQLSHNGSCWLGFDCKKSAHPPSIFCFYYMTQRRHMEGYSTSSSPSAVQEKHSAPQLHAETDLTPTPMPDVDQPGNCTKTELSSS